MKTKKKESMPGDMFNAYKKKLVSKLKKPMKKEKKEKESKKKVCAADMKKMKTKKKKAPVKAVGKSAVKSTPKGGKGFVPYYGGFGGKMSNGAGWGGEKPKKAKKKK